MRFVAAPPALGEADGVESLRLINAFFNRTRGATGSVSPERLRRASVLLFGDDQSAQDICVRPRFSREFLVMLNHDRIGAASRCTDDDGVTRRRDVLLQNG